MKTHGRTGIVGSSSSRGSSIAPGRSAWPGGHCGRADRRSGGAVGARAGRVPGGRGRDGIERGRVVAAWPTRPTRSWSSTRATSSRRLRADLRGRRHARGRSDGLFDPPSSRQLTDAGRRLHHLPWARRWVLLGSAPRQGTRGRLLDLRCHDLREHTADVHRSVDDCPVRRWSRDGAAGGAGVRVRRGGPSRPVRSSCWVREDAASTRRSAHELARARGFSLLCGRYEGVDHRIRQHVVDGEVSVGDCCPGRRRGGCLRRHRGGDEAATVGHGQRGEPR